MINEEFRDIGRIFRTMRGYDVTYKVAPYCCRPNNRSILECLYPNCTARDSCGFRGGEI